MRTFRMITPANCIIKIQGFISRMERLDANNYTIPRLRVQDLNALIIDVRNIHNWASIGIFNKNKKRANDIIDEASTLYPKARKLAEEHLNYLLDKKQK